jgi:adenylate cyclase
MGDGALVEFASVVEAVQAAIECQRATAAHEAARPADERIAFRIGINLGDVVHEPDGDILGDGVNIAARLLRAEIIDPDGQARAQAAHHRLANADPTGLGELPQPRSLRRSVDFGGASSDQGPRQRDIC